METGVMDIQKVLLQTGGATFAQLMRNLPTVTVPALTTALNDLIKARVVTADKKRNYNIYRLRNAR
jgi:DNA-binding HxlR family transcriptional regulator